MNCRKCGAKKADDVEEHMPSSENEVTDPELLRQAKAGPNWVCEYCGGQERNLHGECKSCGGPRSEVIEITSGKQTERLVKQAKRLEATTPTLTTTDYDIRPRWASLGGVKRWLAEEPKSLIIFVTSIAALVGMVWFFIWLFTPKYVNAKVDSVSWEYTSNLRTRETRHDGEWGHPGSKGFYHEAAFNVDCNSKYYGDEKCHPHDCNPRQVSYSCNCTSYQCNCTTSCTNEKNGYSRCTERCSTCSKCSTCYRTEYSTCYDSCPVYKDWCDYDYYEWPISKTMRTNGEDHKVYWPDLKAEGYFQRVQNIEQYQVKFSCSDGILEYQPRGLSDFSRFLVGEFWRLRIGKLRSHNIEELTRIRAEKD